MKKINFFSVFLALVLMSPLALHGTESTPAQESSGGQATPAQKSSGGQATPMQESSGGQASALPLPEVKTYEDLRHAISEARVASRTRIEKAVEQERVREAWEIGRLINGHVLHYKERADYAKQVLQRLAEDLGMSHTELYYMLEFARTYSIVRPAGQLTWSHYQTLLSVNDPKERKTLTERAEKENWSRRELRREIKKMRFRGATVFQADSLLEAKPGTVGTFRVLKATVGEYKGELVLDLGFSDYFNPEKKAGLLEGDIVRLENGKLQKSTAGTEALYTYRADVVEVIDGDTFKAAIPLGFGFTTVQKLRLRGLDAPEIQSAEGREAKAFLKKQFAKSKTPVLIKTVKSDKYDRYLADVWVDGAYINQQLVEKGLAVVVEE